MANIMKGLGSSLVLVMYDDVKALMVSMTGGD